MKLAPFATGLAIAGILAVAPSPAAHAQSQPSNVKNDKQVTVEVKSGDTLDGIATANKTTYVRLYQANADIQDPDLIFPGEKIRIPNADEQLPDRQLPSNAPVAATPVALPSYINQKPAGSHTYRAPATVRSLSTQGGAVSGCGDNSYAHFIYSHESGCRTTAMSPNGCYGIGQACPAGKIAYCGSDYACQNAFFTRYAGKYGGWAGAYDFWVSHGWW